MKRCSWCNLNNPLYIRYHDEEWGQPNFDERYLLEMLILESFQAGLSWECVLNKREAFRQAYDQFDLNKICSYDETKLQELAQNKGIIRNRLKIKASVENAKIFKAIQKEYGSFYNYLKICTQGKIFYEVGLTRSKLSDCLSADLKKKGMKFVGTTIIYSYLQAIGVVNSHDENCDLYHAT
ncbi:DNA-3-methyladenine glycosylase I [Faecalicoccus pleomorphus]|uniref:DNA-3-methyladenine glycosylase I n=1 Tax=Faecalicoccus pleomorphus TaxID=1323 RepID=UPI00195F53EA|nr:DNA-3-methyladenine glycosylase I [Faecalicoccus pleomorphus]MBM6677552.1 DNA-3-methyladenine glycosylase I [Faecalicoccus pleomorphus]